MIAVGYYASLFGPIVLLSFLWRRAALMARDRYVIALAIATTLSYVYLMIGGFLLRRILLGSDYSGRFYTTVAAGTFASLVLFVVCLSRRSTRGLAAVAALFTAFAWLGLWVVNLP